MSFILNSYDKEDFSKKKDNLEYVIVVNKGDFKSKPVTKWYLDEKPGHTIYFIGRDVWKDCIENFANKEDNEKIKNGLKTYIEINEEAYSYFSLIYLFTNENG